MSRNRYITSSRGGTGGSIVRGNVIYTTIGGMVGGNNTQQGLEKVSTTKVYDLGTRLVSPDGCVYRYALASGSVISHRGAVCPSGSLNDWTTVVASGVVGAKSISVTLDSRVVDDLKGGYIVLHPNNTSSNDNTMNRKITGNDVTVGGVTKVYFEPGLSHAMTTGSDVVDVFENPYNAVYYGTSTELASVVGIPMISTTSGNYLWIQTWGPCLICTGETFSVGVDQREVVFGGNQTIMMLDSSEEYRQRAGFIIDQGSGPAPLIMLQISP